MAVNNNSYTSEEKDIYRNRVWDSFPIDIINLVSDIENNVFALIFPSKEGQEIEHLLRRGIPEEKIIAIDKSPAVIAVSTWRKKHPKIKFYGCNLSELHEKLIKNKQLIGIGNLDLCNNFSKSLISELQEFFNKSPIYNKSCFSITIAKGRESTETNYLLDLVSGIQYSSITKCKRSDCLIKIVLEKLIGTTGIYLDSSNYINNRVPMSWFSFVMYKSDFFCKEFEDENTDVYNKAILFIDIDDKRPYHSHSDIIVQKWINDNAAIKKDFYDSYNERMHKFNSITFTLFGVFSAYTIFGSKRSSKITEALQIPNRRV
jgi:hypothetical protein